MAQNALLVIDDEDAEEVARAEWQRVVDGTNGLIARLMADVSDRITARAPIERRWLDCLRQHAGRYSEQVEAILQSDPDRSGVFINITRAKTGAWGARLGDMLFPNDDKNWGISPTPVPSLVESARQAVMAAEAAEQKARDLVDQHNQQLAAGAPPDQLDAIHKAANDNEAKAAELRKHDSEVRLTMDQARRRCSAMEREIDDQLTESRYPSRARDAIEDSCKLGVGVIKGPLTASMPRRRWMPVQVEGGKVAFVLDSKPDPKPEFRRVDPWHFFPDPNATSMDDNESTFERHLVNRSAFKRMAKRLDFHAPTVAEIIKSEPISSADMDLNYLTQLRLLENSGATNANSLNRYVVWEYHGPMTTEEIVNMVRVLGRDDDALTFEEEAGEGLDEHMVICYFCQGKLLKLEEYYPLDRGSSLYSVFPFERGEASILGAVGVPWLMRHEQSMLNSAVRMMIDNAALSVGPQIVLDKSQIEPENGSWKITPRKVWKKKGQEIAKDQAPFATYNIPMNQQQLAGIIELAIRFVDEVVSMPVIAQGDQGAHVTQTSSGMSMLFNSANVVFRRVVKNWDDDITTPLISRTYDWNMQFSDKEDIKGDMNVVARGTSVLLVREVQSQQLMLIAQNWSTHPVIGPAIKTYEVLRMTLQTLSIDPDQVLCTPEEFEQRLQALSKNKDQSPDMVRAQTQLEVAKIDAASRKEVAEINIEIAKLNQQTAIYGLIQKDGVDMAQVKAMLDKTQAEIDSKERMFAGEAAMEERNAQRAYAAGALPTGSGGYLSDGAKPI